VLEKPPADNFSTEIEERLSPKQVPRLYRAGGLWVGAGPSTQQLNLERPNGSWRRYTVCRSSWLLCAWWRRCDSSSPT